ncbi:hypothetical protein IP84_15535 [beta proteobacterium AAP99]|nr:hypothetical protein IP84_15535 [beta proteobacterium AAP99]
MHPPAHIGPNAITRVAEALDALSTGEIKVRLFEAAGLTRYLEKAPQAPVPETEVAALHSSLFDQLPEREARQIAQRAGELTADYLLAHRIPRPLQALLRVLPAALRARLLLSAIARHAWTFAGSSAFSYSVQGWTLPRLQLHLRIDHNSACAGRHTDAPSCDYHRAVFQRLLNALVGQLEVREVVCCACGAAGCEFVGAVAHARQPNAL